MRVEGHFSLFIIKKMLQIKLSVTIEICYSLLRTSTYILPSFDISEVQVTFRGHLQTDLGTLNIIMTLTSDPPP